MADRFAAPQRRLSPTDISQYVRLEQCDRFLRLRMVERSEGRRFLYDYGVAPQAIPPLLTRSGREFEERIEAAVAARYRVEHFAAPDRGDRPTDNDHVAALARGLAAGQVLVCFQPRLEARLGDWEVRGDVDILRLERDDAGTLRILIADMKSSTAVRVEHRLQVAFYHQILAALLAAEQIPHAEIELAILYRGPAQADGEAGAKPALCKQAEHLLGTREGLLERVEEKDAYLLQVEDLLSAPDSVAAKVATAPFDSVFYHLSYKCDGCLYNQFCMKDSFERDDLALVPHLQARDKRLLLAAGIQRVEELARLKEIRWTDVPGTRRTAELVTAAGCEPMVRQLNGTSVGPRLDELVIRARGACARRTGLERLSYVPNKGHSSLPAHSETLNPNLLMIYVDVQHDFLHDRVYLAGAMLVAHEDGEPVRRAIVVRLADGPPDTPEKEERLLREWVQEVLQKGTELVSPAEDGSRSAPIHFVFWNRYVQTVLLQALARHFRSLVSLAPALYDFLTQKAAFDSPIASFLEDEIRERRVYPMVCQSLQAVATYLSFDWHQPDDYARLFRERLFDAAGKLGGEFYTRRARYNSQIPLEYAYVAWGELPAPAAGMDEYAPYRAATVPLLAGLHRRRLDAIEWITRHYGGNDLTGKTPFSLPDLATFEEQARNLAEALAEFVTIERHAELGAWKAVRRALPERRVLQGETLLVRYCEGDQEPAAAANIHEQNRRLALRQQYEEEYRQEHPEAERAELTPAQSRECRRVLDGQMLRLRLDVGPAECDLETALSLSTLGENARCVLYPRLVCDDRLPDDQRAPNQPTAKQMLYGMRVDLRRFEIERDADGRAVSGLVAVSVSEPRGGSRAAPGYVFWGYDRPLVDGALYTLDPDPNSYLGLWESAVASGLCALEERTQAGEHALYERLVGRGPSRTDWPEAAAAGQMRFLQGLDALHEAGALPAFEEGKRDYIGLRGEEPILLIQGPPGTGKSYSTGFAVLSRLQGAMAAGIDFRVFLSCKTHAATDVLLRGVLQAQQRLGSLRASQSELWERYFDARLLQVPLLRVAPDDPPPDGVRAVPRGKEKECVDLILGSPQVVVAATPGRIYSLLKDRWTKDAIFEHHFADLLVLDEASQLSLPEAMLAALPLRAGAQLVVVGDPRQMPPIVKHDWQHEPRRTFQVFTSYQSLFDTCLQRLQPQIRFAESFRLHADMAEFLREEIYRHDGIDFRSRRHDLLPPREIEDPFVSAVLSPEHPLVTIVHDEDASQQANPFERELLAPVLAVLTRADGYALDPEEGIGVVVPHRAQRAAFIQAAPELRVLDPATGSVLSSAVDTVERYQGDERDVILVSATESDRAYLLDSAGFLLEPRRLTVALSRARKKMVLAASRSVFEFFSPDEATFNNSQLWKGLLRRTCTEKLWEGERLGHRVTVWGNRSSDRLGA